MPSINRQFVILLKEDHHAIRQFDALGLLRVECGQRRDRDLLPIGGLGRPSRSHADETGCEKENERELWFHCAPPFCAPEGAAALVSIIPTVRLFGTKV